jgi:hypothetical protein
MPRIALILACAIVLSASPACPADPPADLGKIYGRIQFVEHFPDYRVKIVEHFADLHVERVEHFADAPGKWQIVDSFPDYKIQLVDHFPDFTIKYVEHFPGVHRQEW